MNIPKDYACLRRNQFQSGEYQIRPIQLQDVEAIRIWRNDQIEFLRQNEPITKEQQVNYFQERVWPLFVQLEPNQLLFSFLYKNELMGYGGLVHLDWKKRKAEVSFLLDSSKSLNIDFYKQAFLAFLGMVKWLSFSELNLLELTTETYMNRTEQIAILEEAGFKRGDILGNRKKVGDTWLDSVKHSLVNQPVVQ